ncbi:MAG TPA: porin family protein [Cyclobacteriaceae bacterium]|nr:porin family protein [Cyclobacteriaceae bacterium]
MKTFISCFLLLSVALCTQAQWKFEVIAGPSLTTFTGKEKKDWGATYTNPKIVLRGNLGLRAERLLSEKFFAGGGIVFALKGTVYEGDVEYYNSTTYELEQIKVKYTKNLTYLDLPLYAKYVASQRLKILMGLQPSFLLAAKIKNDENARTAYPDLPKTEDAKDYYTPFDLAAMFGPLYQINDQLAVQVLIVPGVLKMAKAEAYSGGGMTERKYKVNNAGLSFTIVYLIRQ